MDFTPSRFLATAICRPSSATSCREPTIFRPPSRSWSRSRPRRTRSPARSSATATGSRPRFAPHGPRHHRAWPGRLLELAVRRRQRQQAVERAGCNVIRMNMRNCGGTERLSPTLYHSGLSGDVDCRDAFLHRKAGISQSISLIGYSMGGNLVLKLAGELGTSAPPELRSVSSASRLRSTLGPSADALHLPSKPRLRAKFLRALLQALPPQGHALSSRLRSPTRHGHPLAARLRRPHHRLLLRLRLADDYYYRAAAARVLDRIAVPTLILHASTIPSSASLPESREKTSVISPIPTSPSETAARRPLRLPRPGLCAAPGPGRPYGPAGGIRHLALRKSSCAGRL
jgi:pimeloyl-ACP methyl ester carboxylesterase